jgi:alkaline phosphatase
MRRTKLSTAVAVAAVIVTAGAGSAAATGAFSRSDDDAARAVAAGLSHRDPKNVIFFLGDGMGTQEITAARYYQGVRNKLNVDRMPFSGFDTTWSVKPAVAVPPSQQHTGAVVPVWGSGPDGLAVLGTNDHTKLFRTLGG